MKYVPSLPPPVGGVETGLEVKALAGVKRAKPVQARTLPPSSNAKVALQG